MTNLAGLIPLAIAAIGAAYGGLVLRSARHHRDGLVFGMLALTDAAMTAWRALNVLAGDSMVDPNVTVPCAVGTVGLAVLTIEFLTAFPRRAPMRWRWRAPLWTWAGGTVAMVACGIGGVRDPISTAQLVFFAPCTLLAFGLCVRSYAKTTRGDERTVVAMLAYRWAIGFLAYFIAPFFGLFEIAVWFETTVGTLVSLVAIGTAVLRGELFSSRSSMAEAVTIATIALVVVLGGGACVWLIQTHVPAGTLHDALLVGATLVPLGLAGLGWVMYPRVERRVLAPLDERRARRLHIQGESIPTEAAAAIAEAAARIAAIGDGATVKWLPAVTLAPALAADLRDGEPLKQPAGLVVPALGGDRALVGAFGIDGGLLDRDTYLVARELAARVALVVERAEAVTALDDARRLAALGQFAAAIAHDIRTPLTSISLNVQILRRKLELSDDDREHLDIALEELGRLDRSVAEILDFAKPVKLASEAIDVGELLETAARGLSPVLSEKGVALALDPAGGGALTVHGDPHRLRQVLTNLVDNAAEASPRGARVTLRAATAADRHVAIEVVDEGRGIGADDLPRIFEPFFTTRPDGTGLGLAICHKVVRAHGGDIRVRSTPGAGSIFTVTLPQSPRSTANT